MPLVKSSGPEFPSVAAAQCPSELYRGLREQAPIYELPGHPGDYVVTRHRDIARILADTAVFALDERRAPTECGWSQPFIDVRAETPATEPIMLHTDPPELTGRRRLALKALPPTGLRAHEPVVQRLVDALIDRFIHVHEVELISEFAMDLPASVFCAVFGLPPEDTPILRAIAEGGPESEHSLRYLSPEDRVRAINSFDLPPEEGGRNSATYLASKIMEKYQRPGNDALSIFVQAQVERDGHLNLPLLQADVGIILGGGVKTTAHLISSAMMLLVQHPHELERVTRDPALIPRVIEEALRLEPPVLWRGRIALADTEIGGVRIRRGSKVLCVLASGNRDEATFPEPDAFELQRPNLSRHLAFGYGPHFCLGAPLGRLEAQVAIRRLVGRLKNIRLSPRQDGFAMIESSVFHAPKVLWVAFD